MSLADEIAALAESSPRRNLLPWILAQLSAEDRAALEAAFANPLVPPAALWKVLGDRGYKCSRGAVQHWCQAARESR